MFARIATRWSCRWAAPLCGVLLLSIAALPPRMAAAAEIRWHASNFTYVAQDKPLRDFIREFAASQGVSVVVAPEVAGTVNGKFNMAPQEMLNMLSLSFSVTWYYDGSVLYVSPEGDLSTEVVQLRGITAGQMQQALKRLGVLDGRFPISYDPAHDTARVSGPKRYVQLVRETLRALAERGGGSFTPAVADRNLRTAIRVFPLRYAWAADFTYTADGQEYTLPGVVSVLRNLYAASPTVAAAPVPASQNKLARLSGMGYFRDGQLGGSQSDRLTPVAPQQDADGAAGAPSVVSLTTGGGSLALPQFQADGRMNAVVVRDVPERMPFYEQVIRALDIKPALVEIEARVLEISEDSIDTLGVDWRAHSGSASVALTPANLSSAAGGGPVLTTVLGDSGRSLMARVSALANRGKAKIVSTPNVLTLDNVEAVLENRNTFFVPVAGNLDVGLYHVSVGTSLRVTPLLVNEGGRTQIKLAIRIEDGGITQQSVGKLPVVQRTTLMTQAFITEGESLLVGGYKSSIDNDTKVGVPVLSSIPVLGALFRHHEKGASHVEHLFLLTPRVVQP